MVKKSVVALLLVLFLSANLFAVDGNKFGKKPNLSQTQIDEDLLNYYNKWKGDDVIEDASVTKGNGDGYLATYDIAGTDKPIYIIKGDSTGTPPDSWKKYKDPKLKIASTSEATGYGMIIFALMADKDPNAQKYFDGLMNLYLRNLSNTTVTKNGVTKSLHTMSWIVPSKYTTTGNVQPGRSTSAADGDLDIAYALLLADKKWGTVSTYADTNKTYRELAILLINDIKDYLISPKTYRTLMGDWAYNTPTENTWDRQITDTDTGIYNHTSTRPSDWMPAYYRVFNTVVPDGIWGQAISEIYRILPKVSGEKDQYTKTSLVPDFVEDNDLGEPVPCKNTVRRYFYDAAGNKILDNGKPIINWSYHEKWKDNMYGQNACRVPFRMAIDFVHYGNNDAFRYLQQLNSWSETVPSRKLRGGVGKIVVVNNKTEMHYGWEEVYDFKDKWMDTPEFYTVADFPKNIHSGYTLDGTPIPQKYNEYGKAIENPNWESAQPYTDNQFIAPIGFATMVLPDGLDSRYTQSWNTLSDNFGGNHVSDGGYTCYFGDSINLMNMLLVSGYWFNPAEDNGVEKNFRNARTQKWYSNMQQAIDESQSNDTIHIYTQEQTLMEYGETFATITGKTGLTIKTFPGAPRSCISKRDMWGQYGIRITNSSDITIENIYLSGLSLRVDSDCSNITIDNMLTSSLVWLSGNNIEVKNCFLYRGSWRPISFIEVKDVNNFLFHHNTIYCEGSITSGLNQSGNNTGVSKYYNNLFKGFIYTGLGIVSGNSDIRNNVFTDYGGSESAGIYVGQNGTANIDYNLYPSPSQMVSGGSAGANKVIGDPKVELEYTPATRMISTKYKLGSPVLDAGVHIPGITENIADGNPDLGPLEVVNAAAAPLAWAEDISYAEGNRSTQNGENYIAAWDNTSEQPGADPYPYSPWDKLEYPTEILNDPFYWGTGGWYNYNASPAYAVMYNENGVLRTDIYNGGTNLWDVHVSKGISLEKGSYYTVIFDAKTESKVKIQVLAGMSEAPYSAYSHYQEVELTSEMTEYSFTFKMNDETDMNAKLEFDLGGEETPQDIWIDNVRIIKE